MTRPPRTDRYRCPIGSKPRVKRPGSEFDPVRPGRVKKTDGPGGNGPIPTIQSDGSNDPPAIQADPAPDPVTPISAHGRVKWSADGRVKKPDQNRPDSRARVKTSPHATQRITASSRGNDVLAPLVCRIRNGRKTRGARSVHGPSGPVRATRVPIPAPDPISAGRRSLTWVKTRGPGPDMIRAETMHSGCPFLPEPGTRPSRNQQNRKNQTQRNQDKENTERQTKQKEPEKQAPTPQPSQKNQKTRKRPRNQQTRKPNITKRQPCASCTHPVGGRRERRHS